MGSAQINIQAISHNVLRLQNKQKLQVSERMGENKICPFSPQFHEM